LRSCGKKGQRRCCVAIRALNEPRGLSPRFRSCPLLIYRRLQQSHVRNFSQFSLLIDHIFDSGKDRSLATARAVASAARPPTLRTTKIVAELRLAYPFENSPDGGTIAGTTIDDDMHVVSHDCRPQNEPAS